MGAKVRQGPADIIGEGVDVFTPPPLADIITGKKSAGDFKIGELLFGALGVTRGGKGIKAVIRAVKKPETFAKKEGAPLSTRLRDEQVVKLLEEHGMGVERLVEGGIRATSKAVGPGGKVTDSVKTFRNPTVKQVRNWLGF